MRSRADIVGPFSNNVVSFSNNVVLSGVLFSANVVPKPRMLSGRAIYVLGPLQIVRPFPLAFYFYATLRSRMPKAMIALG
jgi:hypothetical protein